MISRIPRPIQELLLGGFLVLFLGFSQYSVHGIGSDETALVPPPPAFIGLSIDPRIVRRLLGVRLLVADLLWIDTLVKSDIAHEAEPFTPLYRSFKTITVLDPDNLYAYYVAGLYLSVIKDDVKGSMAILREGVQQMESHEYNWPNAWNLPFLLGYNLIYEEQDVDGGAKWVQKAGEFAAAPPYVKKLGEHVSTEQGRLEVASRILTDMYRRVSRADEKAKIEKKMLEVASKQDLLDLNEKFQRFLSSTGAFALPKNKQFQLFMKSDGHPKNDILGRPLGLDAVGKIRVLPN